MKSGWKWLILAVVLVVVIVAAALLYPKLSEKFGLNMMENQTTGETQEGTDYSAPDFTVLDYNGNEVKLSDFEGKPVVLNFWATWCYYCKEEMPDFNKAFQKYPNIQFLMVNATDGVQETISSAKAYVEQEQFEFPVFFDTKGEAVKNYYVTGFPATYFIDKDGNLVTYANGMLSLENLEKGIQMIAP